MKKGKSGRFRAAIFACMITLCSVIPAYAETEGYGPGYVTKTTDLDKDTATDSKNPAKGESLGIFTTTGYCNCEQCSGGHTLTYSGTIPQANHTLSADLTLFPVGTKLIINDIVYTVEDMGSAVKDNVVDIYYATHQEAIAHGTQTQEVFTTLEETPPETD